MKKLFLASIGARVLDKIIPFLGKPSAETTVMFIPTAADPYEDKWFVDNDRESLKQAGFKVFDFDFKNESQEKTEEKLNMSDIIFVAGGNVFYLLEKAKENGFDQLLKKFVKHGKTYIGSSAGSVFVGPDVEPVNLLDDPKMAQNLKSTKGVGLVDFVVIPHYGREKYKDRIKKIMKKYKDYSYELIPITDEQVIMVDGKTKKTL